MRSCVLACLMLALAVLGSSDVRADKIDATPGRKYKLTKQHGPWMIMVASLYEPPATRKKEGMSPQEAADKLVLELRQNKIPAYTYEVDDLVSSIQTVDRQGRETTRSFKAQKGGICVIAGNYKGTDDRAAKETLEFIKAFQPKSWKEDAGYRITPGQPNQLSGAFLTINPLLSPEEVAARKRDSLLLKLNGGAEYSIMDNKGKYTLVIGTFTGRTQIKVGEENYKRALENFQTSSSLDDAGERAWKVAKMLRTGMIDGRNKGQKFEAYVFHDRYKSLVTVGAFDRPNDPRIEQLAGIFGAKTVAGENGKQLLTGEGIVIPGKNPDHVLFDPKPRLIEVPLLAGAAATKPASGIQKASYQTPARK